MRDGDRRPEPETGTGDRRPEPGDRNPETGTRNPETGDRRPEPGDRNRNRRPEPGDRTPGLGRRSPHSDRLDERLDPRVDVRVLEIRRRSEPDERAAAVDEHTPLAKGRHHAPRILDARGDEATPARVVRGRGDRHAAVEPVEDASRLAGRDGAQALDAELVAIEHRERGVGPVERGGIERGAGEAGAPRAVLDARAAGRGEVLEVGEPAGVCLLYTSDAADEL